MDQLGRERARPAVQAEDALRETAALADGLPGPGVPPVGGRCLLEREEARDLARVRVGVGVRVGVRVGVGVRGRVRVGVRVGGRGRVGVRVRGRVGVGIRGRVGVGVRVRVTDHGKQADATAPHVDREPVVP